MGRQGRQSAGPVPGWACQTRMNFVYLSSALLANLLATAQAGLITPFEAAR